jgi:twitching motility protein PilT
MEFTDIHIKESDLSQTLVYPGPRRVDDSLLPLIEQLYERCKRFDRLDFMVQADQFFFRGRKDTNAVDGVWYRLRRMPPDPPSLETLPSPIPEWLHRTLMSPSLTRGGGLIYVCGSPGSGKTTTASATVVSRLREYGGVAYTIEDPPEMPLNGWHGEGYCSQSWIAGDASNDWVESFRGVLRSQPAGTPLILFIGEVRDGECARGAIRAASNGYLTIATGFGSDPISSLDSFVRLGGEDIVVGLANMLRVLVYQSLTRDGQLAVSALVSPRASSSVANRIRSGRLPQLSNDMQFQRNLLLRLHSQDLLFAAELQ